ncbi:conserved hypothetical protein [Histoplasma capsulatum G186AR]|uniref:Phospholipase/carboxylesterase/thioesterase domain-containing protein n=2 Tax=Ajellomyces capsulatus TaxID=5037 RepID=C0NXY4_AJECG|nr:uncharacterized protein HCBG_07778 [Histoplasma capsulatum G186AR]EEH03652.1 conserved hypothetical protein [Histoplasma capsulatum G186AR]KAG5293770.1 acyl-protein thioesterase [Histoplasma capsulatum]QSS75222.1 acyl-protein thioesterase [Histoplasma capsulatum G186AR]
MSKPDPPSPLPFPKPTIIPPRGPHTHTLIFLHGRGDNSLDFSTDIITAPLQIPTPSNPARTSLPQRFPGIKFIFPDAKISRSTAGANSMMPQWFDVATLRPVHEREWELSRDGLRASVRYLLELVREEGKVLGGVGKVIVGGLSQGAVVALGAAVAFDAEVDGDGEALGGCVAMSGWLPFQRELDELVGGGMGKEKGGDDGGGEAGTAVVDEDEAEDEAEDAKERHLRSGSNLAARATNWFRENILGIPPPAVPAAQSQSQSPSRSPSHPKTPIWISHGALDEHVLPQFGENAAKTLERLGWNVTFMLYDDLSHWFMPDELADMAIYLNVVVGVPDAE